VQWPGECPLNEADCAYLIRVLTVDGPQTAAEIRCCEEVGLPIPQIAERNEAVMSQARLMLEKFWPQRIPDSLRGPQPVG
jgi:hypothetical protein